MDDDDDDDEANVEGAEAQHCGAEAQHWGAEAQHWQYWQHWGAWAEDEKQHVSWAEDPAAPNVPRLMYHTVFGSLTVLKIA